MLSDRFGFRSPTLTLTTVVCLWSCDSRHDGQEGLGLVSGLDEFCHVEGETLSGPCESLSQVLGINLDAAWHLIVHFVNALRGLDQEPGKSQPNCIPSPQWLVRLMSLIVSLTSGCKRA